MYKNRHSSFSKSDSGVSEIFGTIFLVAITVVIAASLMIWVQSQPMPVNQAHTTLSASLVLNTTGGFINISHLGGEALYDSSIVVKIYVNDTPLDLKISDGRPGASSWITGQAWSYYSTGIHSSSAVRVSVIDTTSASTIMSQTLSGGTSTHTLLVAAPYSSPASIPADNATTYIVYAHVSYIGGGTPANANVTANLSEIGGSSAQAMTYNSSGGWYQTGYLAVPTSIAPTAYLVNITAVDSGKTAAASAIIAVTSPQSQGSGSANGSLPLSVSVAMSPSSVPADNATTFRLYASVAYSNGTVPTNASVTANLSSVGGSGAVVLMYNATTSLYESSLLAIPTNVSAGTYQITTYTSAYGGTSAVNTTLFITATARTITASSYTTPSTAAADNTTTFKIYASVSYATGGGPANATVTANLASLGGSSATVLTYNATSGLYESAALVVPFNIPVGMYQINIAASFGGASSATSTVLSIASSPTPVTTTTYTPASSYSTINSTLSSYSSSQNWTDGGAYSTVSENYSTSLLANQSMFVYASGATQTPFYRLWNGTNWSAPLAALDVGGGVNVIEWIVLRGNPVRNEYVLVTLGKDGRVVAQVYNGTTGVWGNLKIIATAVGSNYNYRGFDAAYETLSGRALVVSQNNTGSPVQYIWNGASWSGPATIDMASAGAILWIRMESSPLSNEIAMIAMNSTTSSTGGARGIIWNGSAWTNLKILTTSTGNYKAQSTGISYEALSGRVMFAWGENATEVYYWLYNGSAGTWVGAAKTLLSIQWQNKTTDWLMLRPDQTSNRIMLGVQDGSRELDTRLWNGSSWDTVVQHPRHDSTTQSIGGRNFDVAFMYTANRSGYAWLLWGSNQGAGQQVVYAKQWNGTAWGTSFTLAGSDATDVVALKSTVGGILFAGLYEDTASTLDDLWESRLTATANWTTRMIIDTNEPTANQPSMCQPFMIAAQTNNSVTSGANTTVPMTLQYNIIGIPQNQDSYFLQFNANPNGKTFYVYVFDGTAWNLRKTIFDGAMTLYNYALLPSEIIGDTVYVKFVGASNNTTPVSIYFDYIRVKSTFTG